MTKSSRYRSKFPGADGLISYDREEDGVWRDLLRRQERLIEGRACDEFFKGLQRLELEKDKVPQIGDLSARIEAYTRFRLEPVPAVISPEEFFGLLARRKFPVATFIRRRADFDYLPEPDVFHEIFGHCPFLTLPDYAAVLEMFGRSALEAGPHYYWPLQRLFWFTVEFGLLKRSQELRLYGAGLLSSPGESLYALKAPEADRRPFDLISVLRTPYRIDLYQPVYYVIEDFDELLRLFDCDLKAKMDEAGRLGQFTPRVLVSDKGAAA